MTTYLQKDIFLAPIDILFHCCNSFRVFGCGIAKEIKNRFPEAYEADLKTGKGDKKKLGTYSLAIIDKPETTIKYIYNLYGQFNYSREKRALNYEAIYRALESARNSITNTNFVVGIPYLMGCSNAGGSWTVVEAMIKDIFDESAIQVLICKKN